MSLSPSEGRHARLLTILRQLQLGSGLNASELAVQLDVCRRTVFRDLHTIRQAGVELYFDEHLDCYRLLPHENLAVVPTLSQDELTTLAAAAHLSVLRQLPDCQDVLSRSFCKLLANSPRPVQHHVERVIKSCCVRDGDNRDVSRVEHIVHHVLTAISQRRMLRVQLVDPDGDGEVETHLAPYQMIAAVDAWQVVARSSHHRGIRTFDPQHMKQPEITDQMYAIPRRYQSVR